MESLFENKSGMISKGDFLEYQKQLYLNINKKTQIFFLIGGILLIIGGTANIILGRYLYAVIFYLIGIYYFYSVKNNYKMMSGREYLKLKRLAEPEYNWVFYEDKAVRKTSSGEKEVNLNALKYILETENCIIFNAQNGACWVDKSGFSKGSVDKFRQFLTAKSNTGEKYM